MKKRKRFMVLRGLSFVGIWLDLGKRVLELRAYNTPELKFHKGVAGWLLNLGLFSISMYK